MTKETQELQKRINACIKKHGFSDEDMQHARLLNRRDRFSKALEKSAVAMRELTSKLGFAIEDFKGISIFFENYGNYKKNFKSEVAGSNPAHNIGRTTG